MPIDLYACTSALPSRMRVIHCCLLLLHTSATSGTMYHTEDYRVHAPRVLLDHHRATDGPHEGHKPRCSPCTSLHIYSSLDQYSSTDGACDAVCS